jgi:hypothetical protein
VDGGLLSAGYLCGLTWTVMSVSTRFSGTNFLVLIFASTNFRENLFSQELIFAIEIFENFANFANSRSFEYFAVTYFRDLAIFLHFPRTI